MPQSGRRPQHQTRPSSAIDAMSPSPPIAAVMPQRRERQPRHIGFRRPKNLQSSHEWTSRGSLAICLDRFLGHLGRVEIAQWLRTNRSDLNKMMLSRKDFRTAQARWVAVKRCAMKNGILTVLAGAV